ncbi:hypothetical protein OG756_40330 [Streptomyces sp. NBC_01310]|uniref:hypothetical protein n=1 Tax=Streptomyces sp. NBC_01310 TaxID=2903820 RepID=UPI0035B5F390|nr:hypothetical protein OG756_01065 [Streptomyces sp. NBC_01310]WSJ63674.1 hypothetical protein OG756_40330 [Streptomyces sp. NBC_01310]
MSSDTKGAGIKDDYAQQIAGDLSANQNAQDRVRSELQRLQEELSQLEDNSKILLKMQDALGVPAKSATTPAAARRTAKRAAVPSARKASPAADKSAEKTVEKSAEKTGEKAGEKAVPAKSAASAGVSRSRTRKAAAKPAAAVKKDTVGPSWLELVTAVFAGQSEPRSAAEVTDSLTTTHPDRKVQAAVIRNTLEQGVARGLLERSKQGRSVYYLPTASPAAPAESAPTGPLA